MKLLLLILVVIPVVTSMSLSNDNYALVIDFLHRYGYLINKTGTAAEKETAIREFQRKYNLTETGQVDEATLALMKKPRCGFPDKHSNNYVLYDVKWDKNALTYKFDNYLSTIPEDKQRSEVKRAFDRWSDHTKLTFTESSTNPDLKIGFYEGAHHDSSPFDGPGLVLAHAFYPKVGFIHFDKAESWKVNETEGVDLFTVALHEIGHALGIKHSTIEAAVMYPYYSGYKANYDLNADDISAIQALYGKKTVVPNPDKCVFDYDAIVRKNNIMYGMKDKYMVKIDMKGTVLGDNKTISSEYTGIETVDAVACDPTTNKMFFFKGSNLYIKDGSTSFPLQSPVKFAFAKDDNLHIYLTTGQIYITDLPNLTTLVDIQSFDTQTSPLKDVSTAMLGADKIVRYYANKKQYKLVNNQLAPDCIP